MFSVTISSGKYGLNVYIDTALHRERCPPWQFIWYTRSVYRQTVACLSKSSACWLSYFIRQACWYLLYIIYYCHNLLTRVIGKFLHLSPPYALCTACCLIAPWPAVAHTRPHSTVAWKLSIESLFGRFRPDVSLPRERPKALKRAFRFWQLLFLRAMQIHCPLLSLSTSCQANQILLPECFWSLPFCDATGANLRHPKSWIRLLVYCQQLACRLYIPLRLILAIVLVAFSFLSGN